MARDLAADPTLGEADRLRNVARAPAEPAEHENRLAGFERETGLLAISAMASRKWPSLSPRACMSGPSDSWI